MIARVSRFESGTLFFFGRIVSQNALKHIYIHKHTHKHTSEEEVDLPGEKLFDFVPVKPFLEMKIFRNPSNDTHTVVNVRL